MTDPSRQQSDGSQYPDRTTWKEAPWLAIKGFLMGSADIIPGVSGGTLALITGIYDRLIHAVRSVDHRTLAALARFRFRELFSQFHWKFLLILLSGILVAIFFFTRIVPLQIYMHTHPEIVYGLFFGLILGSVYILLKEIDPADRTAGTWVALLLGILFGFWIVNIVPADTPESFSFVFLSGMLALCAMILPGISGSYILLILGKYDYILNQLAGIGGEQTLASLWGLLPLVLGGITGLALFSRVLTWLLDHYHALTLMVLIGIMIGSLYVIWPFQERVYRQEIVNVERLPANHPLVLELRTEPADTMALSWLRLREGEADRVATSQGDPEANSVEVERVERVLVNAEPYIPGLGDSHDTQIRQLAGGVIAMFAGLALLGALDYLRRMN